MAKAKKPEFVASKAAPSSVTTPVVDSVPKSSKVVKKKPVAVTTTGSTSVEQVQSSGKPAATTEELVVESTEAILTESFNEFMSKLQTLSSQMGALKTEFRILEKKAIREIKAAAKINAKRRRKSSNRSPSGFVKPTLISDELANFLNKPVGTEMARTEVTREINGYIRAHSLQDKQNGRKINPDTSLAKLLKIEDGQELTYFNLQRYMSPHFAKATPKVAAVAPVANAV